MRSEPDETATAVELLREACAASSSEMPDELGLEDPHAMRTLGRVLTSNATPTVRPPRYPRPPRPPGGRRIVAVAAPTAAAVAAGIALTVVSLEGSTEALAAKFPVFASRAVTPTRGATATFKVKTRASAARAIQTPHGTAYIASANHGRALCLAAPLASAADFIHAVNDEAHRAEHHSSIGYLGGCSPLTRVEARGLLLTLPVPSHRAEVVLVLPAHASAPTLHPASGAARSLKPHHGAVATVTTTPATLYYTVAGRPVSAKISAQAATPYRLSAPEEH